MWQPSQRAPHGVSVNGVETAGVPGGGRIGPTRVLKSTATGPVGSPCGWSRTEGKPYGHEPLAMRRFSVALFFLWMALIGEVQVGDEA